MWTKGFEDVIRKCCVEYEFICTKTNMVIYIKTHIKEKTLFLLISAEEFSKIVRIKPIIHACTRARAPVFKHHCWIVKYVQVQAATSIQ